MKLDFAFAMEFIVFPWIWKVARAGEAGSFTKRKASGHCLNHAVDYERNTGREDHINLEGSCSIQQFTLTLFRYLSLLLLLYFQLERGGGSAT